MPNNINTIPELKVGNTYGEILTGEEITSFLAYTQDRNDRLAMSGIHGIPICIWGTHGIGKTDTVINFAKENNYSYVYCAPAQFEEMGDLHGIPETYNPHPEDPSCSDSYTIYRPPQWLKTAIEHADTDKPGFLILDDFNRAEPRILQGCMQLLQMHALFSWKLPSRWQIILTANPENGPYAVNEMDDAMITRMLHVTMKFDAKCWAKWALTQDICSVGIDFVLSCPNTITGVRTTARSITQFLQQISAIQDDLQSPSSQWLIRIIGKGTMDEYTIERFFYFLNHMQKQIIQPDTILNSDNFNEEVTAKFQAITPGNGHKKEDILQTIITRVLMELEQKSNISTHQKNNLVLLSKISVLSTTTKTKLQRIIAAFKQQHKSFKDQK